MQLLKGNIMFNSLSAFKSTTKSIHTAFKNNPKLKIGQLRELICESTPYGSMAAYEASFTKDNLLVAMPNLEKSLDNEWNRIIVSSMPTFEESMHNEFNRLASRAMIEYMSELSISDISSALENYSSKQVNKYVPNLYQSLIDMDSNSYDLELTYFKLKESKHNMGVLMYSLPSEYINDAKSQSSINEKWDIVINLAFFFKLRRSLFAILEIIQAEFLDNNKTLSPTAFIGIFHKIAKSYFFHKDGSFDVAWNEMPKQHNSLLTKYKKSIPLNAENLPKILKEVILFKELICEHWDNHDGEEWTDALIIVALHQNELLRDIEPNNELFYIIRNYFNQTCNFYLEGYKSKDDFNNVKNYSSDMGESLSNDIYCFLEDAKDAMIESDFDEYELIWLRSSNGEESKTYTKEEFLALKAN
jgi:hypothetical protein